MKRPATLILTAAWLLCAAVPCFAQEAEAQSTRSWEHYQVVVQRNIFSRHRVPMAVSSGESEPTTTTTAVPQSAAAQQATARASYALVGVAIEEDRQIAFFENPLTQETIKSAIGDELLGGVITAITIDGIEYELDGQTIMVLPGQALTGEAAPTTGVPASSDEEEAGNDATSSILERMRLRRQEELE